MDDILASVELSDGLSIHVATLSRQTVKDAGAEHLGFGGYFLFEDSSDNPARKGINILGKPCSLEAAFRLADLWDLRPQAA